MIWTIYTITNVANGKKYVGLTTKFKHRMQQHCVPVMAYRCILSNAIQKYGKESFEFLPYASCKTLDDANFTERLLIRELNTRTPFGYNISEGGGGSIGVKNSPETRRKKSIASSGRACSPEQRLKISIANTGKKRTPEVCALYSRVQKARKVKLSPDAKEKFLGYRHLATTAEANEKRKRSLKGRTSYAFMLRANRKNTGTIPYEVLRARALKNFSGIKQSPEQIAKRVASRLATIERKSFYARCVYI